MFPFCWHFILLIETAGSQGCVDGRATNKHKRTRVCMHWRCTCTFEDATHKLAWPLTVSATEIHLIFSVKDLLFLIKISPQWTTTELNTVCTYCTWQMSAHCIRISYIIDHLMYGVVCPIPVCPQCWLTWSVFSLHFEMKPRTYSMLTWNWPARNKNMVFWKGRVFEGHR